MEKKACQMTEFIDLRRYPLDQPKCDTYRGLVAAASNALAEQALYVLPGFLQADGVRALREEIRSLEGKAEARHFWRTPYVFDPPDQNTPDDHPRQRQQEYELSYIYGQQLLPDKPIRRVYEWGGLVNFLSAAVGHRLYRSADPTYDLIVTLIRTGGIHSWHFDSNEFVVSLMLEPADTGGIFEYVPNLRTADNEHYKEVGRLLDGDTRQAVPVPVEAGTLVLFHGHHSMHRVSRVTGQRTRCMVLLSFDHRPGMTFNNPVLRGGVAT